MTGRDEQDWCECEHEQHFPHTSGKEPERHEYGAKATDLDVVKTIYGGFRVCKVCRDTCWAPGGEGADYIVSEVEA